MSEPPATRTLPAGGAARIRLRTRDLDEAQAAGADAYHSHRVSVLGDRDRFGLRLDTVRIGGLTLGRLSYGTEVSVETTEPPTAYQVNVPVSGTVRAWSDDERAVAEPGRAVVHRPGRRHGFQGWASPCRVFGLRIDRDCLEQELKIMVDRPVRTPIAFPLALDLRSGPGRHWWSLVQVVAAQLWDDDRPPHPFLSATLEHAVIAGLLLAAGLDHRAGLAAPVTPARPAAIRRALDLIESHPEAPLTVRDLAAAAGVGVRTLQEGFRSVLGTTPMRYLRDVRLARARQDLLNAGDAPEPVATIAYRWGFSHLGRFTERYRAVYGESPSRTRPV